MLKIERKATESVGITYIWSFGVTWADSAEGDKIISAHFIQHCSELETLLQEDKSTWRIFKH